MKQKNVDKKLTKQVRIDTGLHELLKSKSSAEKKSMKTLVEGVLAEFLEVKGSN